MSDTKIVLEEREIPKQWYNIAADLPHGMQPPLHPGTMQPVGPEDLAPVFPMNLIEQEVSQERWIDIPDGVLEKLLLWRPALSTLPYHVSIVCELQTSDPVRGFRVCVWIFVDGQCVTAKDVSAARFRQEHL